MQDPTSKNADLGGLPWRERAFLPLTAAAEILGVSAASVYGLEAKGRLSFSRLAGRTLVSVDSLKALIDNADPWTASDRGKEARAARARQTF
ncbi:hypothetical protein D516_2686 [Rhodobacter sp. AKP1]|nr:hypothetical protein D516_2686 [Rhodobacter sp. AKP1]